MFQYIILSVLVLMLLISSLCVYFGYLKICNDLYVKVQGIEPTDKSPYSVRRIYNETSGRDLFYIYENDKLVKTKTFFYLSSAYASMNELEKLGGYKVTKSIG